MGPLKLGLSYTLFILRATFFDLKLDMIQTLDQKSRQRIITPGKRINLKDVYQMQRVESFNTIDLPLLTTVILVIQMTRSKFKTLGQEVKTI